MPCSLRVNVRLVWYVGNGTKERERIGERHLRLLELDIGNERLSRRGKGGMEKDACT
jgi:hypothetical protein